MIKKLLAAAVLATPLMGAAPSAPRTGMTPLLPSLPGATLMMPVTDEYHGVKVTEHYRWLEDGKSEMVKMWTRAQNVPASAPWVSRFRQTPRLTLVAGSTWQADEAVLLPAWRELVAQWPGALRLILAPHEPTAAHLAPLEAWAAQSSLRCARLDAADDTTADVVLVDRVGVLGDLYAAADVAFVGGGFHSAGLHSVLEPAAFGSPVLFGPQFANSRDASLLLRDGGARVVSSAVSLREALDGWLAQPDESSRRSAGEAARRLDERGLGAADRATELVLGLLRR